MSIPFVRYVDFEVLEEPWNKYELNDGTVVRLRTILTTVFTSGQYDAFGKPVYQILAGNVFTVHASRENKSTPTVPPPDPAEVAESIVDELTISRTSRDDWNQYRLEDGTTLKVKSVITSIKKTSKFDAFGEPLLLLSSQPLQDADVPKGLWRRPEKPGN